MITGTSHGHGERPTTDPIPADRARAIELVIFDVDGVLTDGGVYLGRDAEGATLEFKRFDIQDGLGLKMLERAGMTVVLVSGRVSAATSSRAEELGLECHQDPGAQKLPVVRSVMERLGVAWPAVAMLADDLPDVAVFEKVGLAAAVANAVPTVREMAHWRSGRRGGHGAVRDFCDALLAARGQLDEIERAYVDERRDG